MLPVTYFLNLGDIHMSTELSDNKNETKESSEPHSMRDPKIYEAILKIRKKLKTMAESQKQKRLKKIQKDVAVAVQITVLHRIYLEIRGKEFEDVHNIREGWDWYASSKAKEFRKELGLDSV